MASKPDGGWAFPIVLPGYDVVDGEIADHGMSLRDWFAGMALTGILSNPNGVDERTVLQLVPSCYKVADEMIAARNKEL